MIEKIKECVGGLRIYNNSQCLVETRECCVYGKEVNISAPKE